MMIGTPPKTEPSDTENHTPKLCINSLEETHNNSKENVDQLKWRSGQITIKQNHLIMLPEDWKLFRNAILIDQIDFHRVFSPLMVAIVTIKRLLVLVLEIGATILETVCYFEILFPTVDRKR
jgi:hypothetical protein